MPHEFAIVINKYSNAVARTKSTAVDSAIRKGIETILSLQPSEVAKKIGGPKEYHH